VSQPVYTSLDPLTIRDGTLDIGRGNWRAGGDLGELTRPKWLAHITIDGTRVYGSVPRMPSAPETTTYPGELPWDKRLTLPLGSWSDGKPHAVVAHIFAAQFFEGWGDYPDNAWEWGHFSADDGRTPAVLTTTFTLGTSPAPTPPPPSPTVTLESAQTKAIQALYDLVEAQRRAGRSDEYIRDTLYYQVIRALSLPVGDGRRARVKDAIKAAISG
jgi:hypothetical protein